MLSTTLDISIESLKVDSRDRTSVFEVKYLNLPVLLVVAEPQYEQVTNVVSSIWLGNKCLNT